MMEFGQFIKRKRQDLSLTQTQVAKRLGVGQNYVAYMERGERKPSIDIIQGLAQCLKLPLQKLYLLANPDIEKIFPAGESSQSRAMPPLLKRLAGDHILRQKHNIGDEDIQLLTSIRARGQIENIDDYVFLLMTLRQVFK